MKNSKVSAKMTTYDVNQHNSIAMSSTITTFKTRLIISFMLVFTAALFSLDVKGSGESSTEQRNVSGYNQIEIGGAFKVILVQGSSESVTVEASTDVMKNIITKVEGKTLKIYIEGKISSNDDMKLTVNFKELKSIDCSGSIHLTASAPLKFDQLDLESSGASKANLELTATKLDVDISGSGHTTLKGSANNVELDISGSGKLIAPSLETTNYDINISGAGSAEISVSTNLDVDVSGAGIVKYKGDPKVKKEISGAGKVEKM